MLDQDLNRLGDIPEVVVVGLRRMGTWRESNEVTQLALTLPAAERAKVANRLLESLDDVADSGDVQQAWTDELATRVDDIVSGKVQTIGREQVRQQLAADRAAR